MSNRYPTPDQVRALQFYALTLPIDRLAQVDTRLVLALCRDWLALSHAVWLPPTESTFQKETS